jgi:hypothetical protein
MFLFDLDVLVLPAFDDGITLALDDRRRRVPQDPFDAAKLAANDDVLIWLDCVCSHASPRFTYSQRI